MNKIILILMLLFVAASFTNAQASDSDLQRMGDQTTNFLRSQNILVPYVSVKPWTEDQTGSYLGAKSDAYAIPSGIFLNPAEMDKYNLEAWKQANGKPNHNYIVVRAMLHEYLHFVQGMPTYQRDIAVLERGRITEEALVDAVTFDLMPVWTKVMFGANAMKRYSRDIEWQGADPYAFSYGDWVKDIRKASVRATGYPWKSQQAKAKRLEWLLMTFEQREQVPELQVMAGWRN